MGNTRRTGPGPVAIHSLVFLAGFTFLLYEVSWNRLLSLVLGTTITASTLVLAAFMAGFGIGAWFWGRIADRTGRSGRLLAGLLAGIGVSGLLTYLLVTRAMLPFYSLLSGRGVPSAPAEALAFFLTMIVLALPAFLMGGVFPVACRPAIRPGRSIATGLGGLYAAETFGSALGGLATGFLLLRYAGQRNTVLLAAAIDFTLAAWIFFAARSAEGGTGRSPVDSDRGDDDRPSPHRNAALLGTFACGFAMLGLQVLWLRIFRIYLTNTSYTFALISSVVILGLFAGGLFFRKSGGRITDHRRAFIRIILLLAASTGAGLLLLVYLPQVLMFPFPGLMADPTVRVFLLPVVASLLVVFPPAVFSGYAFPLACRMVAAGRGSIGGDVGRTLMVNTAGSVLGPLAAAFLLMPLLGAASSIVLMVVLLAGAALLVRNEGGQRRTPGARKRRWLLAGGGGALLALLAIRPHIPILPPSFIRFDRELLFYRESVEGTLSVGRDRGPGGGTRQTFVNNSAVIGSSYDAIKVVKMVGHLPFFLGLECRDVLVVGFGIGVTTAAIASHPEVESIECVELVEGLKDAAVYYEELNGGVAHDPRLSIIPGDGRHYLQRTAKRYDLISCDPTHPILGSGNLYTKEYFALCRDHLKPGGMVSQYLPLHKLRTEEFLGIIATFHSVFPNCTVWLGHYHAVLLGSPGPIRIDFSEWAENIDRLAQDDDFYADPYHLAATLVLDGDKIESLADGTRLNGDDRSYTEFFAPACLDPANLGKNLAFLMENRIDVKRTFRETPDPERLARFIGGNRLLTESLYYRMGGDDRRALEALRQACRVNPEDREFPFLIRLYY